MEVYSNERMVNNPKDRERDQLYALTKLRPIAGAKDQHGHDMTQTLTQIDRHYFDDFRLKPFKGFAEDWSLTLDLGVLEVKSKPVLMLQSWSYWNSSAAIVAASQTHQTLWGPILDVLGQDGRWRTEIKDLGVSAGLPRMMVVDLSPHLKSGEHVVRIRSNRTLYYDQVLVADKKESLDLNSRGSGMTRIHSQDTPLLSAQLRWLGYPRRILPDGKFPEVFDYSQISPQADWGTHAGMLTRYGDVLPLLQKRDDRFVIMEHGEEVALSFDARRLPPLPPGWKRTFFFYSDGFAKGNELHSLQSETVDPLPFHSMESYPSRQSYPDDEAHILYLLDWNTRPSFMRR